MIFTEETTDEGQRRVYATRNNTVVTYFVDDGEGGTLLHMEAGWLAYPDQIRTATYVEIRRCVLIEAGRRLCCQAHEVESLPFDHILTIADPLPRYRHHWAGRSQAPRRASR